MTELLLGPLLRYVDESSATVWVETSQRCTVTVRCGDIVSDSPTFTVHGHSYAVVDVLGLAPGSSTPYTVELDGQPVWPPPDSPYPPSRIATLDLAAPLRIVFGSCRTSVPHDAAGNRSHGVDALRAYALRMVDEPDRQPPSLLLFLGDQVYADETSDAMREFIAERRNIDEPPGEELKDFQEYAHLYWLAWTDPANRWLLSTVSTAMIFDDHDIRDDWNTSAAWREQMAATPWWHDRIVGGLASYWVYQHLGNLSPAERDRDGFLARVRATGEHGDAGALLDEFAEAADEHPEGNRWSYARELGTTRLVVLDSRCGRVLRNGERKMLDDTEMAWFEDLAQGDVDHLLIGTGLPFLLPMGLHHLEAWNEAVSSGKWGRRAGQWGEKLRQGADLEHWAAFENSFQRVGRLVCDVAMGNRGGTPASVLFLSGDVHNSYLAEADLGRSAPHGRLLQAVCSPIRNPLPRAVRFASGAASYGLAWPMGRLVARSAKVPDPPFTWRIPAGPWFRNSLATIELDGRHARICWEAAEADSNDNPTMQPVSSATIA